MEGSMGDGTPDDGKNLQLPANPTRRQMLIGAAGALSCLTMGSMDTRAHTRNEISDACEVIHQEVVFKVSPKRVYEALTAAKQFEKVVKLSAAVQSGMVPAGQPVQVSADEGGAFSAFAGHITGRHVELVPNQRIVQAWRAGSWEPGQYSIARFELTEQGSGTKMVLTIRVSRKGRHNTLPKGGEPTIGSLSRNISPRVKRANRWLSRMR